MKPDSYQSAEQPNTKEIFSGIIYFFYAFDVGDDINLAETEKILKPIIHQRSWPKYLTSYHRPLCVDLVPADRSRPRPHYVNIHPFGALSIVYAINFKETLTSVRDKLADLDAQFQEQAIQNALKIYNSIKPHIGKANFFHQKNSYLVITAEPQPDIIDTTTLREKYGPVIASTLRFEKSTISSFQVGDILESATGYYREDLVIIDTEAAFVYDKEHKELLDFFELATVQQLELRYFDKLIAQQLEVLYDKALQKPSFRNCLPFIGTLYDPISELSRLKVEISVITERLGNSIKTVGEAYYSEIYELLVEKLDINPLRNSVEKKLNILQEVQSLYQDKINTIREDTFSLLITLLIFIELLVAIYK